ncbi:hypothetical protein ACWCY6_20950 [Streptomyces sp. 900105755]
MGHTSLVLDVVEQARWQRGHRPNDQVTGLEHHSDAATVRHAVRDEFASGKELDEATGTHLALLTLSGWCVTS